MDVQSQAPNPVLPPQNTDSSDEIGLKDILREFRLWKELARKHAWLLFLSAVIGGSAGFLYAWMDTPMYVANTRFMLKNEGVGSLFGGQMSSLTGLLGGGQMGTPLERTAEVIGSDRIVGRAQLRPITVRESIDLVINHFIRMTDIKKKWQKDTMLKKVVFNLSDGRLESLSNAQRKAYKYVKALLIPEKGTGVVRKVFDKKSGVLTLSCVHRDEAFAIGLSNTIYAELNDFFVEQMTYSSTNNAEVMRKKLDSIQGELNTVRRMYAVQSDQSLGLLLQQNKVDLKSLSVKEQMLTVMYAEALKNFETYEFINKATIPSLTLIDYPFSPIKPLKNSRLLYTVLIAFVFTMLTSIFIRLRVFFMALF